MDTDMTDALIASLARPQFSPEFVQWLATAPIEEIEGAYAENYKDAHGIKARWVYNSGRTREQWANDFVSLGEDIKEENEREAARDAAFMAMVASVGLADWAKANGIRCEMDLWEHNYRREYTPDPEPFPYEDMARH
jgi:hypothetical protein